MPGSIEGGIDPSRSVIDMITDCARRQLPGEHPETTGVMRGAGMSLRPPELPDSGPTLPREQEGREIIPLEGAGGPPAVFFDEPAEC